MAVVELHPNSLPSKPPAFDPWPELSSAYDRTLCAEIHAAERVKADQSAQNNVIFARIAGYLLLETFERRGTLGNGPCRALVTSLLSDVREPAEDEHDIVFRVGKSHHDHLIRLCALDFFPLLLRFSDSLQSFPLPRSTPGPAGPLSPFSRTWRRVRPRRMQRWTTTTRPPGIRWVCQCDAPPKFPHARLGTRA